MRRKPTVLDVAMIAAASVGIAGAMRRLPNTPSVVVDNINPVFDYPPNHPAHHLKYLDQVKAEAQAKQERKAAKRSILPP